MLLRLLGVLSLLLWSSPDAFLMANRIGPVDFANYELVISHQRKDKSIRVSRGDLLKLKLKNGRTMAEQMVLRIEPDQLVLSTASVPLDSIQKITFTKGKRQSLKKAGNTLSVIGIIGVVGGGGLLLSAGDSPGFSIPANVFFGGIALLLGGLAFVVGLPMKLLSSRSFRLNKRYKASIQAVSKNKS